VHGEEWYALIVKSNNEKKVARTLSAKGFQTFVPVSRETRQWTDRTVATDFPLFSCVVFCCFDPSQRLSVLNTPGVLHIAGGGQKPHPVESAVMHDLQTLYKAYECRVSQSLVPGTAVSIPMEPEVVTGIPLKSESRSEIAINIEPLGCAVLFTLPPTITT
jgi:transcription antitermination factor NusG